MRELTSHKVNGLNEALRICVCDSPGPGGANHSYSILSLQPELQAIAKADPEHPHLIGGEGSCVIKFQNGPIQESGVNGISNEALLAIVEDRLLGFQSGEYACRENAIALTKIQEAMMWLHKRTLDRVRRGVEGTNQK